MLIKEVDFATIEYVWRNKLWPGRPSLIEPYSAMMFMHDRYDVTFASRPRVFLGGYIDDKLIAVNSLHLSEKYMARSRGIWVDPEFRNNGYGTQLLCETNAKALELKANAIWSFPRKGSFTTYKNAGYVRISSWLDHGEFGPNCYAICFLSK